MFYQLYQARQDLLAPLRITADVAGALLQEPHAGPFGNFVVRSAGGRGRDGLPHAADT